MFFLFFFFFKQKTAYEMRISDWSSDVCSSDLTFSAIYIAPLLAGHGPHCAVAWRRAAPRSSGGRLGITELSAKVYRPAHENRRAVAAAGHCGLRYSSPLLSLIPRSFNLRCRADRSIPIKLAVREILPEKRSEKHK